MQAAPDAIAVTTSAFDFAKIPKARNNAIAQRIRMTTKPGLTGAARDLKGHQEPRSCDLIGEGAHGRESPLLFFGRRRDRAEKSFDGLSRRERNNTYRCLGSTELGTPERVIGALDRLLQPLARDRPGWPQFAQRLVELQHLRGKRVEFGLLSRLESEARADERSEDEREKEAEDARDLADDDPRALAFLRLGQAMLNEQAEQAGRQDRREDQNADEYDRHEVMGSSAGASERALAVSGLASHRARLPADDVRWSGRASKARLACRFRRVWRAGVTTLISWPNTTGIVRFQQIIRLY